MKKILAMTLAVLMILSILPMSVFAANSVTDLADAGYTIISDDESTLAPGVTMNEVVMYDSNGERVEMYITTSDPSVPTVQFYANYKDNQCAEWGMQTLSEQVAAMEANYEEPFKVVAGLNASYYNITNGAPTGAFVMEGVDVSTNGDGYSFFAVLKNGTVMIGSKGDYSQYKGQIKEAIGGYIHLVKDGEICAGLDRTTKYPRQTIGITADGKVITMTADGSQAPQTIGLTVYEQAEVMLKLGCVEALHLDGGNSATFGAVREGSDKFETVNTPSGQAERAVSNTLMIVSTAVADGAFDHAVISGDYDYFLPDTSYTFSAIGVDATNAPANSIPESVIWTLSDDSFGTIENGTFTSNGKVGDVDIQMMDNGEVVGSKSISVVHPESISFGAEEKTVPYGKTASMKVIAMYNNNEAYSIPANFDWTVKDASAGTLSGFDFTATDDETINGAVITATYKHDSAVGSTSVSVKFGKGSEVLFDFEDGDISNWCGTDTIGEWIAAENKKHTDAKYSILNPEDYGNTIENVSTSVFLATEEDGGRVKTGEYSLGLKLNRLNAESVGEWIYNYLYYTGETQIWRDVANGKSAVRVGMWVNMPQNATNTAFRICRTFTKDSTGKLYTNYDYMMSDFDGKNVSYNTDYGVPESGWIYIYYDLTAYNFQSSTQYNPNENYAMNNGKSANGDYFPALLQFINGTSKDDDTMEELVLYIDDITLDYSDVIDDRNAPVISDTAVSANIDSFVALNGQTVANNYLSFSAAIADTVASNATGLDYTTAKIYIDGIDMSGNTGFKAASGSMTLPDVYLTNGTHSITFVICDKQGNETRVTKTLTVNGTAGNAVITLGGHNNGNHTPKAGSIYYIDVKSSDAAQIEKIVTTLYLNSANTFEYEHIIRAEGVDVTGAYDSLNRELTLTITHDGTQTGEAVLVSIPVRVWAWDEAATGITASAQFASGNIPVIDIECKTVNGEVTYAGTAYDTYITGFYASVDVATELDNATAWHAHSAAAMADKAATCTEDGYTDRTYCEGCASVVDWGTTKPATGHSYSLVSGALTCGDCGDTKTVSGLYKNDGNTYYFINSVAQSGWQYVDGSYYYFDTDTYAGINGEVEFSPVSYEFEDGKLVSGVWAKTLYGRRYYYGPTYYNRGWQTIDGEEYFFDEGICLADGYHIAFGYSMDTTVYYFDENGACKKDIVAPDGFYTDKNGTFYCKDGSALVGTQLIDGVYYYFSYKCYAMTGTHDGRLYGDDYKAYTGILEKNDGLYYYNNGKPTMAGLVEIDGDYYFAKGDGEIITDRVYYVWKSNGLLPEGDYEFGADGKMLDGIVEKEDGLYYYETGKTVMAGLVEIDGDYYFARGAGEIITDRVYYVWKSNGLLPEGNYEFGADGKMLDGIVEKEDGLYYYENGKAVMAGLVEIDGDYYFARGAGEIITDRVYYVWKSNGLLPEGNYEFGADGKMLDGIVEKEDGLYYYENGKAKMAGLVEVDGDYYFATGDGVVVTDGVHYVWQGNGYLPESNYEFAADGKMLNGFVEKEDGLYYYVNGKPGTVGLNCINGDYYFVDYSGKLVTNRTYYVWKTNGLSIKINYTFDETGKVVL